MIEPPETANRHHLKLTGDDAKTSISEDEFGLKNMVGGIAQSLAHQVTADGYILGVEGKWGSGKSTFVNFVAAEVSGIHSDHHIIRFEPWLISDRDKLLAYFFEQLASNVYGLRSSFLRFWELDRWKWNRKVKNVTKKVRKYGAYASALSTPVATLAVLDPTGTTAAAAVAIRAVGEASSLPESEGPSLEDLKSEIVSGLKELRKLRPETRFTVIIDDLDRLESTEAIEILRLVRKVADFPLVCYLLCYDRALLSEQVNQALKVEDGNKFIDKIFQNVISMPPQEPFALRRFLQRQLQEIFPDEMNRTVPEDMDFDSRRQTVLENWAGKFLNTPRDVVRLVEAVKLGWPHISDKADFFDFVWLQIVKLSSVDMYDWVQSYLSIVGAYGDSGRADDDESKNKARTLKEIMVELDWGERAYQAGLSYFLPGTDSFLLEDDKQRVFNFKEGELNRFEDGRRLGSPSHWRLYFAFDHPSYAVKDDEVALFLHSAKTSASEAAETLRVLAKRQHHMPGHFLEVLIDRLSGREIPPEERQGIALAFAEAMDDVAKRVKRGDPGQNEIWRQAYGLLTSDTAAIFEELFGSGLSINWLAYVLRRQGFAHGLPDDGKVDPDRQWLTREQLDSAIQIMVQRFRALGAEAIFQTPEPITILFCWLQLGDKAEVREFVANAIQGDEMFLEALSAIRGRRISSDEGLSYPLYRHYVDYFTDADIAKERLDSLARPDAPDPALRERAENLLKAWEDDPF